MGKTMPMATFLLVNPVTDTGHVREDILVYSAALPCSSSTRTGGGASPHQQKTAMFQPPKPLLQVRRTSARDQEAGAARDQEVDHNSHPTPGEEVDKDDSKEARVDLSPHNL